MSILNAPSLMFEIFPFIFLITSKFFYLKLIEKNELEILNSNGIDNLKLIFHLSLISALFGVFYYYFIIHFHQT